MTPTSKAEQLITDDELNELYSRAQFQSRQHWGENARIILASHSQAQASAELKEQAMLAASAWANPDTTVREVLVFRDGYIAHAMRGHSQAQAAEAADEYAPTPASESAARVGVLTFHLRRVVLTYEAGEKARVPLSEVIEGIRDFLQDSGWKRNAVSLSSATPPASPVASEREGLLPNAGESWFVKIRDAGTLSTFEVLEVSAGTVLVRAPGSYYENRFEISDLKFVERVATRTGSDK